MSRGDGRSVASSLVLLEPAKVRLGVALAVVDAVADVRLQVEGERRHSVFSSPERRGLPVVAPLPALHERARPRCTGGLLLELPVDHRAHPPLLEAAGLVVHDVAFEHGLDRAHDGVLRTHDEVGVHAGPAQVHRGSGSRSRRGSRGPGTGGTAAARGCRRCSRTRRRRRHPGVCCGAGPGRTRSRCQSATARERDGVGVRPAVRQLPVEEPAARQAHVGVRGEHGVRAAIRLDSALPPGRARPGARRGSLWCSANSAPTLEFSPISQAARPTWNQPFVDVPSTGPPPTPASVPPPSSRTTRPPRRTCPSRPVSFTPKDGSAMRRV